MAVFLSSDPNDRGRVIVDTTPTGADPDAVLSFEVADTRDEAGDALDAAAVAEQPWPDLDPEAERPDEQDGELSFGIAPVLLGDTSTRASWLQSALKAIVAPGLPVDGEIGPHTVQAVQQFQRRSEDLGGGALVADGAVDPGTIAALAKVTKTRAPTVEATPQPPPASGELTVREVQVDGVTEYVIRGGDDEVRFSYWTPGFRDYKPHNVSRYKGARKGLLTDAAILAIGYSPSELKILQANALKESGGAFGAINTWDDQIVSWGMAQFAGQAGTLAVLLADLKENPRSRASYQRWFVGNGIDVARGEYPWKDGKTRIGWHVVVTGDGEARRGNEGWSYIRTQPRLLGAFMLAGNDPAIELGQVSFWRDSFLTRAISKHVAQRPDGSGGGAVRRYITSERGLAVLVRLHNWMPGYVVSWSNRFIAELQRSHQNLDLSDPLHWDQALEDAFVARVCDERKRVKPGSYDTYALDLSRVRGSFVGSELSSSV